MQEGSGLGKEPWLVLGGDPGWEGSLGALVDARGAPGWKGCAPGWKGSAPGWKGSPGNPGKGGKSCWAGFASVGPTPVKRAPPFLLGGTGGQCARYLVLSSVRYCGGIRIFGDKGMNMLKKSGVAVPMYQAGGEDKARDFWG